VGNQRAIVASKKAIVAHDGESGDNGEQCQCAIRMVPLQLQKGVATGSKLARQNARIGITGGVCLDHCTLHHSR